LIPLGAVSSAAWMPDPKVKHSEMIRGRNMGSEGVVKMK
jgi:hypothetical protein